MGVDVQPSPAFADGADTRAMIETLAALTAKANYMAGQIIADWDDTDARKAELMDHYAALKENMLNSMFEEAERQAGEGG